MVWDIFAREIHNAATGYLSEEWKYDHIYRILYCLDKLQGMEIKEEKNSVLKERYVLF